MTQNFFHLSDGTRCAVQPDGMFVRYQTLLGGMRMTTVTVATLVQPLDTPEDLRKLATLQEMWELQSGLNETGETH